MKKTVFKGNINGKDFDNIQAYNEELIRLISNGVEDIHAHMSRDVIDMNDDEGKKKIFKIEDFTPRFKYGLKYNEICNELHDTYNMLDYLVRGKSISEDDAEKIINNLRYMMDQIEFEGDKNTNKINELNTKLIELHNNEEIIGKILEYYNHAIILMREYISNLYICRR